MRSPLFLSVTMTLVSIVPQPAQAADDPVPLPDFVKKVQLHNVAGAEPTPDGRGVKLYRVPKSVRDCLTEQNKSSKATVDSIWEHREVRFDILVS